MSDCVEIKECIACNGKNLVPLLDLGVQPLANSFVKDPFDPLEPEPKFPLATNYCTDCFHVQLTYKVNPDLLFKNYLYVSGTAKTQLEYFEWFADMVVQNNETRNVLDIGCNDGSQLNAFKKRGVQTFGVDPAENLYPLSSKNHSVHCGYFDKSFPKYDGYDAVICQNAFAHNYDQLEFLGNMKRVLSDDGLIYITTSQADMILQGEFDTIYHEHLSFYCVRSMNELCKRVGLNIIEVLRHPIHGTSFIFVLSSKRSREAYLSLVMKNEEEAGLYNPDTYTVYREDCRYIIEGFGETVKNVSKQKTVVGYGAPAKGNTLLNAAKVKLDFIIDDNPLKQGMYTPGMNIPVFGSDKLQEYANEDLIFVPLAWNFFDEIRKKIKALRPDREDLFLKTYPFAHLESSND